MSEVRLVVREASCDWSGTVHASWADRALAALSADPVTLTELEAAFARFVKPVQNRRAFANLSIGLCDEAYDAGLVVIDLVARLVVVDSTYSWPAPIGEVEYHNGECCTETSLRYHLADDWLFSRDSQHWPVVAEARRRERTAGPVDTRAVLYHRPLLEFVARETFTAFVQGHSSATTGSGLQPGSNSVEETLREIHAAWLLTHRDDLNGVCPRDVALERHDHLTRDLQDQAERWSLLQQCPPGLDESSFAYRYGGFGTHELVQYYDLVRELLWSCWKRLADLDRASHVANRPVMLTAGDFLASEVPRLERIREEWLDTPDPECHGRTPRSIVDRERARLPEGMSGHDAVIDPNCSCCHMMADMPGPVFWHLDSSEMDDDFAFDIRHRTREEWEAEQREWAEHRLRYDAERAERERLGVTNSDYDKEDENSVWSSSFSVRGDDDVPLVVRLFGISGHLAELISDLRNEAAGLSAPQDVQQYIDQLNRDFGNLRELLQTSELALFEALIDPTIDRFTESLAAVAAAQPGLAAKCGVLMSALVKFLDPGPAEPHRDADDPDGPF